jgi:hypothetical protein
MRYVLLMAIAWLPQVALAQRSQADLAREADSVRAAYRDSVNGELQIQTPPALTPLTFRGHAIGDMNWMTKECNNPKYKGFTVCDDPDKNIGDVPTTIYYLFSRDRLASVVLGFASESYEPILRAFTAKFGAPDSTWVDEWQNRMGARFDNHGVAWMRGRSVLVLRHYGGSLDQGSGTMTSQDVLREEQRAADSAAQRAKQDL